jgi:molecular chaperone GrpE
MNDETKRSEEQAIANDEPETGARDPEQEIAELKDRLLRTLADMENLRQRTRREIDEAQTYGVTRFARDLLDVADNLRRAIDHAPEGELAEPVRNFLTGVEMTEQALLSAFERHKIRKVTPERGERFDHKLHQAVFELPTSELEPGSVAEVLTPGYVIGDRLLRAAMVGVAKAPPEAGATGDRQGERGTTVDTSA